MLDRNLEAVRDFEKPLDDAGVIAGAVRDAGLDDFRFHDLRHTFATRLNESGADPYTIRDLLGHSSTTMTENYTHTSHETRQRAIEAMSRGECGFRQNSDKRRVS